jgi:NAD-dependent dihydropyrimidine dehydrogenase PreA subunit
MLMNEQKIWDRVLDKMGETPGSPYATRVMKKLMTPEEAEMLLQMPASAEELAEKWNMSQEALDAKVQEFIERGLVVPRRGTYESLRGLRDLTLASNPKYVDQELKDLWREAWYGEEREHFGVHYGEGINDHHVRIIPNRLALQKSPPPAGGVLPEEDVETIYRMAYRIVTVPCPCRLSMGNCDRPLYCFQFNKSADYNVRRGSGQELSLEEALEASDECERSGMLHMLTTDRIRSMCHCCGDCCVIVDGGVEYGTLERGLVKSRYEATVDLDLCTGCQDCVENCPCSAIDMLKAPGSKKLKSFVEPEKCWGCGACVVGCPEGALTLKLVRPDTSALYSEGLR